MDVIGELLRANMLEQVAGDSDRAERLRAAARTLTGVLADDRGRLPLALLTAIDPSSHPNAPMLRHARTAILIEWKTLGNVFPEQPVELYRAVLLDAAATAFASDELTAAAGWYTLRTAIQLLPAGRWSPVLGRLLDEWDAVTGPAAEAAWSRGVPGPAAPAEPADAPDAAPGPREWRGDEQGEQDKPAAAQADGAAVRATAARTRALAIAEASAYYNDAFSVALKGQLVDLVDELSEQMRVTAEAALLGRLNATMRRSDLLWWWSTGYSSSRRRRYRDLTAPQAVIAAALDVHHLAGPLTPASVEHVLWEAVTAAAPGSVTVGDLANCTWSADLLTGPDPAEGTFLRAAATGDGTALSAADAPVTTADAAVALFRDLQAAWLLAQPAPAAPAPEKEPEPATEPS
jgi:hypothetical protein